MKKLKEWNDKNKKIKESNGLIEAWEVKET